MIITFFSSDSSNSGKKGSGYYSFAVASWESGELNCIYYKQFDIFEKVIT